MTRNTLQAQLRTASDEALANRYAGELYLLNDTQLAEIEAALRAHREAATEDTATDPAPAATDPAPDATGPTMAYYYGFGITNAVTEARRALGDVDRLRKRAAGLGEEAHRTRRRVEETSAALTLSFRRATHAGIVMHAAFEAEVAELQTRLDVQEDKLKRFCFYLQRAESRITTD